MNPQHVSTNMDHHNQTWQDILQDEPVYFVYQYGSSVKSELGPLSDIDVALYLDPALSKEQHHETHLKLYGIMQPLFPNRRIDIVILNELYKKQTILAFEIIKHGKLAYKQHDLPDSTIQTYQEHVIKWYLDFQPFSQQFNSWQTEAILGRNKL